jgi:hypothetical protein
MSTEGLIDHSKKLSIFVKIILLLWLIVILTLFTSIICPIQNYPETNSENIFLEYVHAQEITGDEQAFPGEGFAEESDFTRNLWDFFLFAGLPGIFGGLLFGIKEKKLVWPHRTSDKYIANPGFITDLLFGLAGGLVIYLILPGSFDFEAGGLEIIKIISISIVGGYGGRALIEKVLAEQLKNLQSKVENLEKQTSTDNQAIALVMQHLQDDPNAPPVSETKLKDMIISASTPTRVFIFTQTRQFRKEKTDKELKSLVEKVIPIFEALIQADIDNKYHRNHAQLAYALIDKPIPDLNRALEEINKAIQIRVDKNETNFLGYEFVRAIINIKLGAETEKVLSDLNTAINAPEIGDRIKKPNKKLNPELISWMKSNEKELIDWISKNNIQLQ